VGDALRPLLHGARLPPPVENTDAAAAAPRHGDGVIAETDFSEKHQEFRAFGEQLRATARLLPSLDYASRVSVMADIVAFLHERVEPHTKIDEQVLYPEVNSRFGSPLATASMAYDHLAIRSWIAKLAEADEDDVPLLQELLYGLDALIRVHLWKEDELYVKPLASSSWPAA
jgi:hemerythrin-like domain-containing protein